MNKELQRRAIAEYCGWIDKNNGNTGRWTPPPTRYRDSKGYWHFPVDILEDLNAIHQAEVLLIKLGPRVIRTYEDLLQKQLANIVFASAAQRAEAFLRTLNLWTDEND